MNWISVKEKMPEFEMPVLICEEDNPDSQIIGKLYQVVYKKDSNLCYFIGINDENILIDVTHWMPLKKVPKSK